MRLHMRGPAFVMLAAVLGSSAPVAQSTPVIGMLDRYLAGRFPEVVEDLRGRAAFDEILDGLRRDGERWIEAGGPSQRERRTLAAATFALEAARAGAWLDWKFIQQQPRVSFGDGTDLTVLNVLYWRAPPLLIEWGCQLLRRQETPSLIERWWQLAALAVAQRSEDPQFLIGDTKIGLGRLAGEIGNTQDEIKHLDHVTERFPDEMRFVLAQGIARDRDLPGDAMKAYRALENDPDVGGEASMRLGAMQMPRRGGPTIRFIGDEDQRKPSPDAALKAFEQVEARTRDPYVVFLARYFSAQLFEQQRKLEDAEAAYRGAVGAVPHAQSATVALASLLFRDGRRAEAQKLIADMLAAEPRPVDPWRTYVHADDRFWPQLIARLRQEILK
jgi:tetratricopeptide (TPR) repeat protein